MHYFTLIIIGSQRFISPPRANWNSDNKRLILSSSLFHEDLLNLDELDFRIIRELGGSSTPQWNVRESYSNISRKIGVDEETVRMRVKRARERGFLPIWRVMVNPRLFGCREASLNLEVDDEQRKQEVISEIIRLFSGVHAIVDFRGKDFAIMMFYESSESLEKTVQKIETMCRTPKLALWDSPFLHPDARMKRLEWKIMDALREDAWRDLEEVARILSVSSRTIQRRLSAMTDGKAIYLSRPPNPGAVIGLMCNFLLLFSDSEKKRAADYEIHSAFNRIGAFDASSEQYSVFGISCENFEEADKVLASLRSIDGVQNVRMRIMKDVIVSQNWVKEQNETRLRF